MTINGTERAIGQLQASVENLADQHKELNVKVDVLLAHMERTRGGWWVLAGVAGVAGTITGYISKWIPHS
jgi:hypothetical protein